MRRARIAVLVSGGGTNFQALIDARARGEIPHGELVLAVSNVPQAYALVRARKAGIPGHVLCKKELGGQEAFEKALVELLTAYEVDLIVLAGFLSILTGDFTARYPNRILNIHPSLIPAFCGKGYYGLRVHQAALEYGVKVTGATVHFVNEVPDGGRIILQKAVAIRENDTPQTLQKRVMRLAEWKLLPKAVELVSAGLTEESEEKVDNHGNL